ncbi:MAG: OmpA family protein [Halomonadaceae bacterium]|nr:MAG: OmpA family protein [Halomonadaceae bacterium]
MSYQRHTLRATLSAILCRGERPQTMTTPWRQGRYLAATVLPLALLSACAGGGEEASKSQEPQTMYLSDVLKPVADSEPGSSDPHSTSTAQQPTTQQAPTAAQQQEHDDMTVMVLEALHGNLGQVVPPPAELTARAATPVELIPPQPKRFHFAFDASELSVQDQSKLAAHARFLKARPDMQLQITGHTDASGPDGYNRRLSYRRAQAVARFLQGKGVDPQQLQVAGLSSDNPLAESGEPHQQRRVELDYQPATARLMSRQ